MRYVTSASSKHSDTASRSNPWSSPPDGISLQQQRLEQALESLGPLWTRVVVEQIPASLELPDIARLDLLVLLQQPATIMVGTTQW